jgi:predicted dehydrogenase
MTSQASRREFLQRSALAGAGMLLSGASVGAQNQSPNEKLNIGMIGVAHQAAYDLGNVSSQNIVALCDIDDNYLGAAAKEFPQAATYNDFRKLLERKDLDAIVIAIPDHCHAPATLMALETGHHVYCEKPLTHTVVQARKVAEMARKHKRVTQMGTQIHAGNNYRRVVELIQSGAIGAVGEVHVWADRAWTGDGRPTDTPPVPTNIHWDLWLGPAPVRPYNPAYLPATWRGWWDFGGGTLSDMACHHIDLSHWALDLRYPLTVAAEGPPVSPENAPGWMIVHYEYPARSAKPPVKLTWYDGGKRPPQFADGTLPEWGDGSLFIGEKGMLLADYDRYVLLPEKDFAGFQPPKPFIPNSIGHHLEWIEACKNGGPTTCNFDYSGALTESVLLGNVAYRVGQKLEWDPKHLKATNCPEAEQYLHSVDRKSWG